MNVMNDAKTKELVQALLALETADEAQRFLRDLLTEAEIAEFGNRFCAAQMLSDKLPYSRIEKATGLSSTTVARVSKWLNQGMDGYKTVIARMHHAHSHQHARAGNGLSLHSR